MSGFDVPWKVRDTMYAIALVLVATLLTANLLHFVQDESVLRSGVSHCSCGPDAAAAPDVGGGLVLRSGQILGATAGPGPGLDPRPPGAGPARCRAPREHPVQRAVRRGRGRCRRRVPSATADSVGTSGRGTRAVANFMVIGVAAPFTEEIFFRAFMLAALVNALGTLRGAVAGSAVFAVSHGNIAILVPTFVSGLLLSWLYITTRSVGPPFIAHAAQNLLALSVAV